MAYVVLARKYRPQRFADLVGQEHVTRTLANAIAHDRVHHAYLFCGARGLGKTTAARLLAKCLVCVKGPTIDPCNVCSECTAVTEGRSVDVIEIDGASNNRVEDVRNLREQVRYLPQTARRKIYIIDEVHMLTGSAFNALLKTLEEPPEHVTFIFATTEVHELPATILSRVSRFDFRRLSSAQLVGHLQNILRNEGVHVEEAGLYTVARAGDGSVRDSLTLLDKVIAFASDTRKVGADEVRVVLGVPSTLAVAGLVEAVLARDATLTMRRFDEVFASGQDLLALALEFLKHLRDLMLVKLTGARDVLVDASDAEYEHLRGQAAAVDSVVLAQHFDRFTRVVDALPRTRVPRLVLEMGLLDLVHSEPLVPLGDLIDRLEQISSGQAPSGGGAPRGGPSHGAPSGGDGSRARTEARPPPTRTAPASDETSPYAKILGSLLTGGSDTPAEPARSPAPPRAPEPARPEPRRSEPPAATDPRRGELPRAAEPPRRGEPARATEQPRPESQRNEPPWSSEPPPDEPPWDAEPPWPSGSSPAAAPRDDRPADPHRPPAAEAPRAAAEPPWRSDPPRAAESRSPAEPGRSDPPRAAGSAAEPPWRSDPPHATESTGRGDPSRPVEVRAAESSWSTEARRAAEDPRSSSGTRPADPSRSAPPRSAGEVAAPPPAAADAADCGGACPGAPRAEGGVVPWTELPEFTAWEQFLEHLRGPEPALFAILADLGLAKLGGGVLRLVGTAQAFARNHLRDQAQLRATLEFLLHQHLGAPFRLELAEAEPSLPDLPSLGLVEDRRRAILQAEVQREAQESPQIQALLTHFGAKLREVRPRAGISPRGT